MLKRLICSMNEELKELKKYLYSNRWYILIACMLVLYVYSTWIFHNDLRVDAEQFINTPYTTYGLQSGRPGKFLTSFLFGIRWYNPYVCTGFGYVLLCISGIFCGYLFYRIGGVHKVLCAAIIPLIYCFPIMVTQFYFSIQVFETAWAYLVCYIAIAFAFYGILKRNIVGDVISIFCMIWAFSTYQTFVILYIAATASCYIFLCFKWMERKQNIEIKQSVYIIARLIAGFLIGLIGYLVLISFGFTETEGYLNGQIFWKTGNIEQGIKNVIDYLQVGFLGEESPFYTIYYGIFGVSLILILVWRFKKDKQKSKILIILAAVFLQMTPFLLSIYLGQGVIARAQLVYPFVLGIDIILCIQMTRNCKVLKVIILGMAFVCFWNNCLVTSRLIYTQEISEKEDMRILSQLDDKMGSVEKPIAFIGSRENELNNACLRADCIGVSIFEHDKSAEPHYFYTTYRVCELAKTQGYLFSGASVDQIYEARKLALNMPIWPAEGSIKDVGDYVIVKLGEDEWAEEILESSIQPAVLQQQFFDANLINYCVDEVARVEDDLVIKGWMIKEGENSDSKKINVYLKNEITKEYYKIASAKSCRKDVSANFNTDDLYDWCGYKAKVPIVGLTEEESAYTIILGYYDTNSEKEVFVDTGIGLHY